MNTVSLDYEKELGGTFVMGIDEAGRGPLAGAVFTAAVYLPLDAAEVLIEGPWKDINDSKKLSPKRRERMAEIIRTTPCCAFAVASASAAEIDRFNILRATHLAMRRAALALAAKLLPKSDFSTDTDASPFRILVDGLAVPTLPFPSRNLVKGDAKSLFIAAASILAKTARDAACLDYDAAWPGYGFAIHKGYPTKAHLDVLARLGPCPEHRRSFAPVARVEKKGDTFTPLSLFPSKKADET